MTKDELVTVLSIAGVDPKTIDAMVQSYEMGFEHGANVDEQMQGAIEYGIAMCEHLDFDEVDSAKKLASCFRQTLRAIT